jgi:hypothetical protein
MIGKPNWFKYRTFGWGVAPKTWQGWLYVAIVAIVLGFTFAMGFTDATKAWIAGIVLVIFIADIMDIMIKLPKFSDERENYHQLIIERNCSFAAIIALLAVALYQTYKNSGTLMSSSTFAIPFDISIAIVLGAMLAAKIGSTIYVKLKM